MKALDSIGLRAANVNIDSARARVREVVGSLRKRDATPTTSESQATAQQEDWARIYTVWARGRLQVGDVEGAIYYFQNALLQDPNNDSVRKLLSQCLRSVG